MSMSDARLFADLTQRVANLEQIAIRQQARLEELEEHVLGKDVSDEVLGPLPDTTVRDGLRTLLKEQGTRVLQERQQAAGEPPNGSSGLASVDPKPEATEAADLASDPALKDRLAALQGGEAKPAPKK